MKKLHPNTTASRFIPDEEDFLEVPSRRQWFELQEHPTVVYKFDQVVVDYTILNSKRVTPQSSDFPQLYNNDNELDVCARDSFMVNTKLSCDENDLQPDTESVSYMTCIQHLGKEHRSHFSPHKELEQKPHKSTDKWDDNNSASKIIEKDIINDHDDNIDSFK